MAQIRDDLSDGRRVYIQTIYGDPAVDRIRSAIGRSNLHYDREKGAGVWWVAAKFRPQVEQVLHDGGTLDVKDPVERAARADQLEEQGRTDEAAQMRAPPPPDDPDDVRLVGKARYKGRTYYARYVGPTKRGYSARLVTLPDAEGKYLDFWARCAEPGDASHDGSGDVAVIVKTYQPREVWDGRRYSGRTVKKYTTLGSVAEFLARQKDPATRRGQCSECGEWGPAGEPCSECGGEGTYL